MTQAAHGAEATVVAPRPSDAVTGLRPIAALMVANAAWCPLLYQLYRGRVTTAYEILELPTGQGLVIRR